MFLDKTVEMPSPDKALPGREQEIQISALHHVNGHPMKPPFPDGCQTIQLAMGCFWGAERQFWSLPGVYSTAVGYIAGYTPNPTYQEVCTGRTAHTEGVLVVYQPTEISLEEIFRVFWESHDPTQGMRQGNDRGTQYRSGIYYQSAQQQLAARRQPGSLPAGTEQTFISADYHRNSACRSLLLRGGISPAVSGEESRWLLWPRRHRCAQRRRLSSCSAHAGLRRFSYKHARTRHASWAQGVFAPAPMPAGPAKPRPQPMPSN